MFEGLTTRDKDPRKSLHVDDVPTPELGPGEALIAVMASAINYNTVWTAIFEPMSTFGFLERYGRTSPLAKRHDLPYHVVGSDLAGVVLRTGPGVNRWKPGDEVVAHCLSIELDDPAFHPMLLAKSIRPLARRVGELAVAPDELERRAHLHLHMPRRQPFAAQVAVGEIGPDAFDRTGQ